MLGHFFGSSSMHLLDNVKTLIADFIHPDVPIRLGSIICASLVSSPDTEDLIHSTRFLSFLGLLTSKAGLPVVHGFDLIMRINFWSRIAHETPIKLSSTLSIVLHLCLCKLFHTYRRCISFGYKFAQA